MWHKNRAIFTPRRAAERPFLKFTCKEKSVWLQMMQSSAPNHHKVTWSETLFRLVCRKESRSSRTICPVIMGSQENLMKETPQNAGKFPSHLYQQLSCAGIDKTIRPERQSQPSRMSFWFWSVFARFKISCSLWQPQITLEVTASQDWNQQETERTRGSVNSFPQMMEFSALCENLVRSAFPAECN